MSLIDQKRDSLEVFIREQMIGPNGCRGKYSLNQKDFDTESEEIINTTPGSIYSTAILFPKKAESESLPEEDKTDLANDNDITEDGDEDVTGTDILEQNGGTTKEVDDEDICSLSRRFPNTIGLTCCIAENTNINKDIKITVSGRYYTKIVDKERENVVVLVKEKILEFELFWKENPDLEDYFTYTEGALSATIPSTKIVEVKELLHSINQKYAEKIAQEYSIVSGVSQEKFRYLLSYREHIFRRKLNKINDDGSYLSEQEKQKYLTAIEKIEMYEVFISYFEDLVSLYDYKSFGYWKSHSFSCDVQLPEIPSIEKRKNKEIFKPEGVLSKIIYVPLPSEKKKTQKQDEEKYLSLGIWLQLIRNSKNATDKKCYLKVLLENTSSPFKEDNRNYFSIVNEKVNELCFFGVKLEVSGNKDCILPYRQKEEHTFIDEDKTVLDFLYREIKDYGIGHLCSVNWIDASDHITVYSEFLPTYETPDVEPIPRNKFGEYVIEENRLVPQTYLTDNECLQFKWLSTFSDTSRQDIIEGLRSFVNTYGQWIKQQEERQYSLQERKVVERLLGKCKNDCQRMLDNISGILEADNQNLETFRIMNSAMFMQLWHSKKANQELVLNTKEIDDNFYKEVDDEIFIKGQHAAWRPFQLAFILLNLDGIIHHPDDTNWNKRNELVDLVWFPTGGGKTEAYLGLIALCIINRRRKYNNKGNGVAVIMRYTLRLLTTQQFQRALRLILALEQIRIWEKYPLGKESIAIGLYVGDKSLPNLRKQLAEEATKWNNRKDGINRTKIPLDYCPWCGSKLHFSDKDGFYCINEDCTFSDLNNGLPVRLCDEDIYTAPPALLFGTVDKFAMLAHSINKDVKKDSRRLFGKGLNVVSPDLIIQDELHLLLGPLGSAVSLYECAVDYLCTREEEITNGKKIKIRPKIISSTATTRNTELQIRALYDRAVNIFPNNGVTYDDSFFAFYKRVLEKGKPIFLSKRKYMGIMPTGRTQMTTQMRLAAILLIHRAIFEQENIQKNDFDDVANNYYSIISYFNSLKELGKTDALFYTEYSKYVKRLFKRVLRNGHLLECFYSMIDLMEAELSGRLSGAEVNEKFVEVGREWSKTNRLPHKESNKDEKARWIGAQNPPDYILATNMISVGLDVSRFNQIIMNSMPRNIAEYIQASSRVARNVKGLVVTLHNPFRSRDVSHFERFREFHEKLYYYVEPISITPFSRKAVDKYLPLHMATVIRHSFDKLAEEKTAINMTDKTLFNKVKHSLQAYFEERYRRTSELQNDLQNGLLTDNLRKYIVQYIEDALQQWYEKAVKQQQEGNQLTYRKGKDGIALFTTTDAYNEERNGNFWTVPMSLRIVEPEAVFNIKLFHNGTQED